MKIHPVPEWGSTGPSKECVVWFCSVFSWALSVWAKKLYNWYNDTMIQWIKLISREDTHGRVWREGREGGEVVILISKIFLRHI